MAVKTSLRGFWGEFKTFIARGSVMDMAVGVIIGGAFKSIADSLVKDIISPILGMFTGDSLALADSLSFPLPGGGEVMLGSFLSAVLNFLITAFVVFCIVKGLNSFHDRLTVQSAPEKPAPPPPPSRQEQLLAEILEELKRGRG